MWRYRRTASGAKTAVIAMLQAMECHAGVATGPPSIRPRLAAVSAVTGLTRTQACSQPGRVLAWMNTVLPNASGNMTMKLNPDPLLSIWGLVTRGTRTAGVQGPEYRVDTYTAIRLYTAAGGQLLREDSSVGILAPGAFADIVGFRTDLLDCPVDDLPSQQPALTLVGGQPVHDPDGLFG
jgi:hypothetical protein